MKFRFLSDNSYRALRIPLVRLAALSLTTGLFLLACANSVNAAAGDLDPTYGNGGKVTSSFLNNNTIRDAEVQHDGKTVVVGNGQTSGLRTIFARYQLNGTLDPTFGSSGNVILTTSFQPFAILVQSDGKIVAGGELDGSFALMRLNHNGSLDNTFGTSGITSIRFFPGSSDFIFDIALQPDGKIVAAGDVDSGQWFALARFHTDGTLDTSFGDGGKVRPGMGAAFEQANAVIIQDDLKIVAGGRVSNGATGLDFGLARFKPNGELDETFGNAGRVFTDFDSGNDGAANLVLQSDGKIIAGGTSDLRFALARYKADGSLDPTFDNDGKVITAFFGSASLSKMVLQSDGRSIAGGSAFAIPGGDRDYILTRYNLDGTPDNTFGNQGRVITDFGANDFVSTIVLQPDNKIVAAGESANAFSLARYFTAPTNSPVLQTEAGSNHALAVDSVTFQRDAFSVSNDHNFSADRRTRVVLLTTNLTLAANEPFSSVSVKAEDAGAGIHALPVEYVGAVPGFEWLTQVVVRLPDDLINAGDVQVSITHGTESNKAAISIK